ncbi:MAG: nitroreductase family protein [Eubacteriales bacterium]|nr:nitroreductase family protein [Eubacteriales bacterium]
MDFYEAIDRRRTIRDFQPAVLEEETVERILSAGLKAPTNDHMRDWHFMVVDDQAVVRTLLERIPKQITENDMNALLRDWNLNDGCQQNCYRDAVPKQYRMLADASLVVIPLLKQKTDIMHPDNLSQLNGFASIWCCIENIFLAATAERYACTLRIPLGNEAEWARKVLQFPQEYFMPCFIGIGKPSEQAKKIEQKQIDVKERIHRNIW